MGLVKSKMEFLNKKKLPVYVSVVRNDGRPNPNVCRLPRGDIDCRWRMQSALTFEPSRYIFGTTSDLLAE